MPEFVASIEGGRVTIADFFVRGRDPLTKLDRLAATNAFAALIRDEFKVRLSGDMTTAGTVLRPLIFRCASWRT
jgi:hypothetical protein